VRVGITGGTGLLGRQVSAALLGRGDSVVVLSRSESAQVPGAEIRAWDGESGPLPADSLDDLDAVVHLAGASLTGGRWTESRKRELYNSRVVTTRNLVAEWSVMDRAPRVLVSASAIGYYGDRGDERLSESAGPGSGFLAGLCADWEAAAKPATGSGARLAVMRSAPVLDPRGGMLAKLLPVFRVGLGGKLGSGKQWMPWIHHADWTRLVLHALDDGAVAGPVNAVAPEPVTNAAFTRELAGALGRPAFLAVPGFALRLAMGEVASTVLGGQYVVPGAALGTGFEYSFPELRGALDDLLG
jgi:hypothetical protein